MDEHSVSEDVDGMFLITLPSSTTVDEESHSTFLITPPSSTMVDEESHSTNRYIVLGPKDPKVLDQFHHHDQTLDRSPSGEHKQQ
jgi:hypothetical protein